ncbi:MAG: hypothetical protein JWM80_2661 [Cyanobacteria bacterium RYN_339]|nr:hypothetical protein [Cyanobacteria bacterium RYN_339]
MKKMNASALMLASLTAVAVLAGCGKTSPAASTSSLPARSGLQNGPTQQPLGTAPGALPGAVPGAAPGAAGANPATILAAVRQAQATQTGFTATIETYEKGPKDAETETLDVAYKRPSTLMVHIVKASGDASGAKVLWTGGSDMKVKPTWMPFSVGVSITDSRVVSKNGWTIKETDVSTILGVLLDPSAQVKALGAQSIQGQPTQLLEVHSPKSPKGVTMEQIGIDPKNNLPNCRLMYKGTVLSYRLVVKSFKLGVPASDALSI